LKLVEPKLLIDLVLHRYIVESLLNECTLITGSRGRLSRGSRYLG
jgi:hypothetical protein